MSSYPCHNDSLILCLSHSGGYSSDIVNLALITDDTLNNNSSVDFESFTIRHNKTEIDDLASRGSLGDICWLCCLSSSPY